MMKQRIEFIDLIKGLAILTVVIGHFIETNIDKNASSVMVYNFIYTFHMPLFMFIGGYIAEFQYRDATFKGGGKLSAEKK